MRKLHLYLLVLGAAAAPLTHAQTRYNGAMVTGTAQLTFSHTVNLSLTAQQAQASEVATNSTEIPPFPLTRKHPPIASVLSALVSPSMKSLPIGTSSSLGFNGLTHADQRLANGGNQFSTEPATPGVAVANGYVLEGIDNAVQVYTTAGVPLLASVVSSNQLFGLQAAINRTTGAIGAFPTDMRVFYDRDINRWFILQWVQANDNSGNPTGKSAEYLAVSQSGDPTGMYNIYSMDTTDQGAFGCPCVPDYPQIGADQYGLYISSNEFGIFTGSLARATILAINKAAFVVPNQSSTNTPLAPAMFRFAMPLGSGFEFSIQPATTPPGAAYFQGNGGLEYFVSSLSNSGSGTSLAVWAMTNTSSLTTSNPSLSLLQITVPTLSYTVPNPVSQKPGPLPYGSTFPAFQQVSEAHLDGGDTRVLSLSYAGGRLYATLATAVTDENGTPLVGGAYFILSPTFRGTTLAAPVLRQGYLLVKNNNLLRSAIAVNAQGRGAVVFTLVGPDYFPSAAFVPIDTFSTGSAIQLAGAGSFPEDGFTGYPGSQTYPIARWGDDSVAVASSDGTIWMVTEYIPNATRTQLANWGTFLTRYIP
jgi:hypothetical protein